MPLRILIAEDNALVRAAMRDALEGVGEQWEIVEAGDGWAAVAKVRELRPDLVVLDLAMPALDGLKASRQISRLLPRVPILLHTLYWSEQIELDAVNAGVTKVVRKSDANAFVSAVQQILGSTPAGASGGSKPEASDGTGTVACSTEDRIRELCDRLFSSKEDDDQAALFRELRAALHDHVEKARSRLVGFPGLGKSPEATPVAPPDRETQQPAAETDPSKVIPIMVIADQAAAGKPPSEKLD
jgi:CheY-like chemotaxis protein